MSPHAHDHTTAPAEVLDPVCGMTIDPADAVGDVDYKGQKYFFCSQSCLERFRANPAEFLAPRPAGGSPAAAPKAGAEYICPMDPEVRQKGPGACPKCGMALEPAVPITPATRTQWTCPMHPEIVRDEPGSCRSAAWRWSRRPLPPRKRRTTSCATCGGGSGSARH